MSDVSTVPSPRAAAALAAEGWSPGRQVDPSRWLTELGEQGYEVSPLVETILRSFGGLRFQQRRYGGHSADTFDVEPRHWYGHAKEVANLEALLGQRICPIGEASGAAMLAVMADGRVISEFEGCVDVLGGDWREALDHLVLGEGDVASLLQDYAPVDTP